MLAQVDNHQTSESLPGQGSVVPHGAPHGTPRERLENWEVCLQICKDRWLEQDRINRDYWNKAIGLTTFAVTLFGIGTSWINANKASLSALDWCLAALLAACAIFIGVLAILCVYKPSDWQEPRNINEFRAWAEAVDRDTFLASVIAMYERTIYSNQKILNSKAKWVRRLCWFALAALLLFSLLRVTLALPS